MTDPDHHLLTRRDFAAGLAMLPWLAQVNPGRRDAKALIVVWLDGGLSHVA